jgi:hypothetical protein
MSESATAQIEIDYLRGEIAKLKEQLKDEARARALLRSKGFFVENLWNVDDVLQNYNCNRGKAYDVLSIAMNNEATIEQIFLSIDYTCEDLEIKKLK